MWFIKKKPNPESTTRQRPRPNLSNIQEGRVIKIVCVLVIIALLWIFFAPGAGIVTFISKRAELKKLQKQTAQIEQQIDVLQKKIDRLNNDPSYLEDVARREFGLLKKNEKVYDFSKPNTGEKK